MSTPLKFKVGDRVIYKAGNISFYDKIGTIEAANFWKNSKNGYEVLIDDEWHAYWAGEDDLALYQEPNEILKSLL